MKRKIADKLALTQKYAKHNVTWKLLLLQIGTGLFQKTSSSSFSIQSLSTAPMSSNSGLQVKLHFFPNKFPLLQNVFPFSGVPGPGGQSISKQ